MTRFKQLWAGGAVLLLCNTSGLYVGTASAADGGSPIGMSLRDASAKCKSSEFKKYLTALERKSREENASADPQGKKELEREIDSALKVVNDVADAKGNLPVMAGPVAYYTVPAMSNIKRTQHTYPEDGTFGGAVRMVAAKGEFEASSLVLYPFAAAGKVELKVSDLVGKNGKIPASAVDLKIVKIWYQTGNAWYSYFADSTARELVPELLLNDENLVKVDGKTRDNYLRVDYPMPKGPKYVWISSPANINVKFNEYTEPVRDAKTLQPFSLTAGEFKQIWLTFEAPKTAEGIYSGTISLTVDGKPQAGIPVEVRVLPFELPDPKTNYDLNREYYTSIYNNDYLAGNYRKKIVDIEYYTGNLEKEKERLFNHYVNMRKHNLMYPIIREMAPGYENVFSDQLEIYKKAGLRTDALFGSVIGGEAKYILSPGVKNVPIEKQPTPISLIHQVDITLEIIRKAVGPTTNYAIGWDEPSMTILVSERKPWMYLHNKGVKVISTANERHLIYSGYNEDFVNCGGSYSKENSDKWHAIGARVSSYASPHTGPENPDFVRRTHGMDLYKADCDGTINYMLDGFSWNDFVSSFRSFNMVYSAFDGPIDTIEWEGFREAIDDVRYATLLRQLANQAIATEKTENVYQGRMALQWLALLDAKKCDLNAARLEMISYILKLRNCI